MKMFVKLVIEKIALAIEKIVSAQEASHLSVWELPVWTMLGLMWGVILTILAYKLLY